MKPYYSDDWVTIYHADCREVVPSLRANALVTDPPYGVDFQGKSTKRNLRRGKDQGYLGGDSASIGPAIVRIALTRVERGAVFTGTRLMYSYPEPYDIGCVYSPAGAGRGRWGFHCFNPILFYGRPPPRIGKRPSSLLSFDISDASDHPCPKPLRWMTWLVELASNEGETILDPFAGSGTTLRAAKELGRQAVGVEIEERYCELAAERCAQEVLPLVPLPSYEQMSLALSG